MSTNLALTTRNEFVYGKAPRPISCGGGVEIGKGRIIPEINFTLPPIDINETTWPEIRPHYTRVIEGACQRAVDLEVPARWMEFETLPEMTVSAD